ncbi:MAG: ankyrin repeat domain-containing protein, partial [Candidatus Methanoplasma sp.]|nr:ankyrin repeat domain-containing protein [Candidatus Methanoplasma sp.]
MLFHKNNDNAKLITAIQSGDVRQTAKLLSKMALSFDGADSIGRQASLTAVKCRNLEIVKMLVSVGGNKASDPALSAAARNGYGEIVSYLLGVGADIHAPDTEGYDAMTSAAIGARLDIMQMFVSRGADVDHKTRNGLYPIIAAAFDGHTDIVNYLIDAGAKVNVANLHGMTSLHWAAMKGYDQLAEILIKAGAKLNLTEEDGFMPLHLAARAGHAQIAERLIKAGAEIDAVTKDNNTPLLLAVGKEQKETVVVLIRAGANVGISDKDGYDALRLMILYKIMDKEVFGAMVKAGIEIKEDISYLDALIPLAKEYGYRQIVARAAQSLEPLLWHEDKKIQKRAADVLGSCGLPMDEQTALQYASVCGDWQHVTVFNTQTLEQLLDSLNLRGGEPDNYVRNKISAVAALGRAYAVSQEGDRIRISDSLCDWLNDVKDGSDPICRAVVRTLLNFSSEQGIEKLFPFLFDSPHCNLLAWEFAERKDRRAVGPLIDALRKVKVTTANMIVRVLVQIGDPRACQPVLDFIYESCYNGTCFSSDLVSLFEDYSCLVVDLLDGLTCDTRADGEGYTFFHTYHTEKMRNAVMKLCSLKTPVASNLLHYAAKRDGLRVDTVTGYYGYGHPGVWLS